MDCQSLQGDKTMEKKPNIDLKKVDTQEFEIPETVFIRDIENRVFQGIVLQCLSQIEGISLVEGNFIDNIFGRTAQEGIKGITAEQDNKNRSVNIKVEVNVGYGISIPQKAEEIQTKISNEITQLTGLHVSYIHVVFKNVLPSDQIKKMMGSLESSLTSPVLMETTLEDYNEEF